MTEDVRAGGVTVNLVHIYEKLGVNDRAVVVATAFERGLLPTGRG
jgi:DNA-binding NarL/FixJ family response regulator